ncbi:MAG: carboxypeptidase regulatory-like domain-containing protein, partial [Planctomycetes bacterium]|nr:carboxypeptidase regulatory-like domain-containing protein [Planctomycetota bacterium]
MKTRRLILAVLFLFGIPAQAETVSGVVRDSSGQVLGGVNIQVMPGGRGIVESNADGSYELTWSPRPWGDEEMACYLVARDRAHDLAEALPLNAEKSSQDLVLKSAVTVTGQVVDGHGQGISDARIQVMFRASSWGSTMDRSGHYPVTNAQGVYDIKTLPQNSRYSFTLT